MEESMNKPDVQEPFAEETVDADAASAVADTAPASPEAADDTSEENRMEVVVPANTSAEAEAEAEEEQESVSDEFIRIDGQPLEQILEALLLASDEPLSIDRIETILGDEAPPRPQIRAALKRLGSAFDVCSYELKETASGFRLQVGDPYARWVGRLREERAPRYSRALLETLALIAYRQPITRGEIEEVRGVAVSTTIIRTLEEREWVRVVGHKEVPGRPSLYATTKKFLDYFNLKSLSQLPTLEEIRDLESAAAQLEGGLPGASDAQNPDAGLDEGFAADATASADTPETLEPVSVEEDAAAEATGTGVVEDPEALMVPRADAAAGEQDEDLLLESIPVPDVTH